MSRIGKQPVPVPKDVTVEVAGQEVSVTGGKGSLSLQMRLEVGAELRDDTVVLTRRNSSKAARSLHGLYRNLVANMVTGVSEGFRRSLLINGVGYRAELQGTSLILTVGYSQPVEFPVPGGVVLTVEGGNRITVSGCSKEQVGQVAALIRHVRPPEPYKGKGIRYENEQVRRKTGKSAVAAG